MHKYKVGDKLIVNGNVAEVSGGFFYKNTHKGHMSTITECVMDDEDPAYVISIDDNGSTFRLLEEDGIYHEVPKKDLTRITLEVTVETDNADEAEALLKTALSKAVIKSDERTCDLHVTSLQVTNKESIEEYSESSDEDEECEVNANGCTCGVHTGISDMSQYSFGIEYQAEIDLGIGLGVKKNIPMVTITSSRLWDRKQIVCDQSCADEDVEQFGFDRVTDSTYEYSGSGDPAKVLKSLGMKDITSEMKANGFMV